MKKELIEFNFNSLSRKVTEACLSIVRVIVEIFQQIYSGVEKKTASIKFRYLKSLLFIFFLLLPVRAPAPGLNVAFVYVSEPVDLYSRLIKAVVQVESLGDTMACNLTEEAVGAFQIRPIRLRDYNQRTGNNYKIEDCYNFEISKTIFLFYAKRIGFQDYELIARNWNGSGKNTLDYWKRVKTFL
jgi:hypothetical protein